MILAVDVKYNENKSTAKAVGVLFNWFDDKPAKTIEVVVVGIKEYIPGQFYKRELPCIKEVVKQINLSDIQVIIVDGYVYINNQKDYGLGGYVYQEYNKKIPVIGVAKTSFTGNYETVIKVFRGNSKHPLYVSAIGKIKKEEAAKRIEQMSGKYKMPSILKKLDSLTKS